MQVVYFPLLKRASRVTAVRIRVCDVAGLQEEEEEQGDEDEEEALQADDSGLLQAGEDYSEASGRSSTVQACPLCLGLPHQSLFSQPAIACSYGE